MTDNNKLLTDLEKLKITLSDLKECYSQFGGTREIVQYETEDYTFSLAKTLKPKIKCYGLTNRTEDLQYIFFADYDKIYKSLMLKNLAFLIRKFPNSFDNFYIIRTGKEENLPNGEISGSYHVINFVKHLKRVNLRFLEYCDVDPSFIKIPSKTEHKTHVLRVSEKYYEINNTIVKDAPEFIEVFPNYPLMSGRECSKAHYKFFSNLWGNPTKLSHNFDNSSKIELHQYSTPAKVTDYKKVCPFCQHEGSTYTGTDNFMTCNKCGNTWGATE